ncbi:ERG2/sigma1 receptor-like protein [Pseudomassariella vexata]|uniref:C-8 sterol isomerase n=1 Tax=Pseudomassariella vexata TaxID=1141098 RepID=A0A1Y2EIR4_9PEZI|nr:ERG2/sigma1 receptor-like protein [Pseudomassariella vexata]ORY71204.1 ERG2/sigma1 receptor-like protein [Pseudomassariella vexata]
MGPDFSRFSGLTRLLLTVGFWVTLFSPVVYLLERNLEFFYIFDKDHLHDLAKRGIAAHGNDTRSIVHYITSELHERYPANVNLDEEFIFNNAGGAMGAMYIIHASVTEYLIIFGTTIGTEGHTGRHTADDYFHILTGEQWAYAPGDYEPEIYPPGSVHHLHRGTVKQYKMPEGCFALEYARGWIPPMLFFGFADGLSSTLDVQTLWRTTWVTGRQIVGNLLVGKF